MNSKEAKKDQLEVSSDQLKTELIEIKERLGALETIASISNKTVVEAFVKEHLTTAKGRLIMKECEAPQTREKLIAKFRFASAQALDYHLTPLREADLIRQYIDDAGTQTFVWSNLFKRLPKKAIKQILNT